MLLYDLQNYLKILIEEKKCQTASIVSTSDIDAATNAQFLTNVASLHTESV